MAMANSAIIAKWNYKGNIKVGNIATFSTLASDQTFNTKYGQVQGTCSGCCEHCGRSENGKRPDCYVFKSYRYQSVIDGHARNTLAVRQDPMKAYKDLSDSLSRKRKPVDAGRFDQSGEIENSLQFLGMCFVAKQHENIPFYVYTKKAEIVVPALLTGQVPKNLTVLISIWHEQNLNAYKKVCHLANVKAFVYCDSNKDPENGWSPETYAQHGLVIGTFCKAYGTDGKMDHNITCQRCRKCFNRAASAKVIGTWAH